MCKTRLVQQRSQGRTQRGAAGLLPLGNLPPVWSKFVPLPHLNIIKGQIMLFYISCDETAILSKSTWGRKNSRGGENLPGLGLKKCTRFAR